MNEARPGVLFVCVRNSGKSQLAAALLRKLAGDRISVLSAGTEPAEQLNAESVAALAEVGAVTDGEHPKPVTPDLLARVDRVVLLGGEVQLEVSDTVPVDRWITDEPSLRGITGMERMRLVRDDIDRRVRSLYDELGVDAG